MVIVAILLWIPAVTPVWSQSADDDDAAITLRLLEEGEGEADVVRELALPPAASDEGRGSSALGLAMANRVRGVAEDAEASDTEREAGQLTLPETASDEARERAAFGLETANEARERGREFGQERAEAAREEAADRRDQAQAVSGRERAEAAREEAADRRDQAQAETAREEAADRRDQAQAEMAREEAADRRDQAQAVSGQEQAGEAGGHVDRPETPAVPAVGPPAGRPGRP